MAVAVWSAPLCEPQDRQPVWLCLHQFAAAQQQAGPPSLNMPIPAAALYPKTLFPKLPPPQQQNGTA